MVTNPVFITVYLSLFAWWPRISVSQDGEHGDTHILPGEGCYDMQGAINGAAHHCLYDAAHCCKGGCEANGGYWIDGKGGTTCHSDPDCADK